MVALRESEKVGAALPAVAVYQALHPLFSEWLVYGGPDNWERGGECIPGM